MRTSVAAADLQRFGDLVGRRLGLRLPWRPEGWLSDLISRRAARHHGSARLYLDHLDTDRGAAEIDWLASQLTVGETYFFRDPGQLDAFANVVVPQRMRARAETHRLRILSAGCACGEEPYTLAMLCRAALPDPAWQVSILGVDVNRSSLAQAAAGRYPTWALRATPAMMRDRWFRPDRREWVLDKRIRQSVVFRECNLTADDATIWMPGGYDVIFCRNVLMYLTPPGRHALLARIVASLAPGGFLFLGQAENLRGFTNDLTPHATPNSVYFERVVVQRVARPPALVAKDMSPAMVAEDLSTAPVAGDVSAALALWEREQFTAALRFIEDLPVGRAADPAVLIVRAMLLVTVGRLREAELACHRLLTLDPLNADACHALATCRDACGDRDGAIRYGGRAAYLDAHFAMPHLLLGLLAVRAGNRSVARLELHQTLMLMPREADLRVLLFGGGFGRAWLVALCRAQILACGGR